MALDLVNVFWSKSYFQQNSSNIESRLNANLLSLKVHLSPIFWSIHFQADSSFLKRPNHDPPLFNQWNRDFWKCSEILVKQTDFLTISKLQVFYEKITYFVSISSFLSQFDRKVWAYNLHFILQLFRPFQEYVKYLNFLKFLLNFYRYLKKISKQFWR